MKMERCALKGGSIRNLSLPAGAPDRTHALTIDNGKMARRKASGALANLPFPPQPLGQFERTSAGTQQITVPEGVRQVSALCYGAGGRGGAGNGYREPGGAGGGGAASAYATFDVSPGEILVLEVGNITSYDGQNTTIKRLDGTILASAEGGDRGGSSSTYLGNATQGGSGGQTLVGNGFNGQAGQNGEAKSESNDGGNGGNPGFVSGLSRGQLKPGGATNYGHGGGGGRSGYTSSSGSGPLRAGAARLIWGENRSYPSTNIQDM